MKQNAWAKIDLMELCYRTFSYRLILDIPDLFCGCLPVNFWSVIVAPYR